MGTRDNLFPIVGTVNSQTIGDMHTVLCDATGRLVVTLGVGALADVNIVQVAGTAVVNGGVAGLLGVGGAAADAAAPAGNPVLVSGSDGAAVRTILTDATGTVQVAIAGGAADVNLIEIAGTNVLTGGVAGSQGVGGLAADDAAASGNPVQVGGVYRAAPAAMTDGDAGSILLDSRRRVIVAGSVADDAAEGTANPVKIGAVAEDDPSGDAADDGDLVKLVTDLNRYLWVRSRAYDVLLNADVVSPTITDADRYIDRETLLDGATGAAATYYYPSSDGLLVEEYNHFTFQFLANTNQTLTVEATIDVGSTLWSDITQMGVASDGANGHASFANVTDVLDFEGLNFWKIRVKVVQAVASQNGEVYMRRRFS